MALNSAWGHDSVTYNGQEMRELVETLTGGLSGVTGPSTALKVSQQTVAAATVKVAEGGAIIPATGAGLGGSYQAYNDADLTSPSIAPTSANGRKDRLILRVTAGVPALEVVQGVASGSPAEPSITGDNYLELALITLPASTTNITDAMITDRRVRLAPGTPVVATSSTRPASPFEGMVIFETDTDKLWVYDGSTWNLPKNVGGALGYASDAAARLGFTTEQDLTNCSVTVTVGANRRLRITGHADVSSTTSAGFVGRIKEGGTELGRFGQDNTLNTEKVFDGSCVVVAPSAGAHTYKLTVARVAGAGTIDVNGNVNTSFILVEDIGGS